MSNTFLYDYASTLTIELNFPFSKKYPLILCFFNKYHIFVWAIFLPQQKKIIITF